MIYNTCTCSPKTTVALIVTLSRFNPIQLVSQSKIKELQDQAGAQKRDGTSEPPSLGFRRNRLIVCHGSSLSRRSNP